MHPTGPPLPRPIPSPSSSGSGGVPPRPIAAPRKILPLGNPPPQPTLPSPSSSVPGGRQVLRVNSKPNFARSDYFGYLFYLTLISPRLNCFEPKGHATPVESTLCLVPCDYEVEFTDFECARSDRRCAVKVNASRHRISKSHSLYEHLTPVLPRQARKTHLALVAEHRDRRVFSRKSRNLKNPTRTPSTSSSPTRLPGL